MAKRVGIPDINPLTQEMKSGPRAKAHDSQLELTFSIIRTASSADTFLLRLPQELKNKIYELVLGGQLIHVHRDREEGTFSYHLCQAKISEKEAQGVFVASRDSSSTKPISRHVSCRSKETSC